MVRSSGRGGGGSAALCSQGKLFCRRITGLLSGLAWLNREMMGGSKQSLRVYQDCNSVILKLFFFTIHTIFFL